MKKPLQLPTETAEQNPQAWAEYWDRVSNVRQQSSPEYRKAYNDNKTKQRQILKMYTFIDKYPDQARAYISAR